MNNTISSTTIPKNDSIDNLSFAFFSLLTFCSILNDVYSVSNNFLKNNYIKKKWNNVKNLSKIIFGLSFKKYKSDNEGNIIIDKLDNDKNNKHNIKTNPFDDEYYEDDDQVDVVQV